jgi:hypothetical protein
MAKKRARTERREAGRTAVKLARARMKLASLEPGGAPDRPLETMSASTVEVQARALPCTGCGEPGTRVEEHAAITVPDDRGGTRHLRVARIACPRCGVRREIYFRIGTTLPS